MEWNININKVENGFIVTHNTEINDLKVQTIFDENLEGMKELLWFINNYFGKYYSKHNKQNIVINIEDINNE